MWNALTQHFKIGWLAFWLLLPLALLTVAAALVIRAEDQRYDATAFTPQMIARYSTQDALMADFKAAVFDGDLNVVMALQGLNDPVDLRFSKAVAYLRPVEAIKNGQTMLYDDSPDWHAFAAEADFVTHRFGIPSMGLTYDATIERVNGRWVITPHDAHYLLHTGKWRPTVATMAAGYYGVATVSHAALWVIRETIARRDAAYRELGQASTAR